MVQPIFGSSAAATESRFGLNTQGDLTPSVVQAFEIIALLSAAGKRLRLSEIISRTNLPKTTAHRLLNTLAALRVVDRNNNGYILGPALAKFANTAVSDHSDLIGLFYSVGGQFQSEIDETIQLAVLTPPDVTFVAFIDSMHSVRLTTRVGRRLPAYASAAGKAILAHSPSRVVDAVLSSSMTALTTATITDRRQLTDQLHRVRRSGWAIEFEESARNLSCIAAPILRTSGEPLAAITVCVPVATIPEVRQHEIADQLLVCTEQLSRRLAI